MTIRCSRRLRERHWRACSDLFLNNSLLKLECQDHKDLQDSQDPQDHQGRQEVKDRQAHQEDKDLLDQREDKDHKAQREDKDLKALQALATHKVEMKLQEG